MPTPRKGATCCGVTAFSNKESITVLASFNGTHVSQLVLKKRDRVDNGSGEVEDCNADVVLVSKRRNAVVSVKRWQSLAMRVPKDMYKRAKQDVFP